MRRISVLIPTYSNPYWLGRCLESIAELAPPEIAEVIVIDNAGDFDSKPWAFRMALTTLRADRNLGWTGALARAIPAASSDFLLFLNDDTEFEQRPERLAKLLSHFDAPEVAMVGPATGIAMGRQALPGPPVEDVKLLIGFCQVVRRSALDAIGGLDERWAVGGDDLDLSIRFRDAGYRLVLDRRVFVYHHAFKTGNRIYGNSRIPGGWNSPQMATRVYDMVAEKHGREKLLECIKAEDYTPEITVVRQ